VAARSLRAEFFIMYRNKNYKGKKVGRGHLFIIIGILIAVAAAFLIGALSNRWYVSIHLNKNKSGDNTVEVGNTYTDPGAKAEGGGTVFRFIRDDDLKVTTGGSVDTAKLGTYHLTYSASYRGVTKTKTRTVRVVDTEAPKITLKNNPDSYTPYGQAYQEEGYSAEDNYDGDLTADVKSEEKDGVVYYTVEDSSGNVGKAERKIVYDDRTAPTITLTGGNETIVQGTQFQDQYTATDDVDGDLTGKVKVDGSVDTTKPGTYQLHYQVEDAHGNKAEADRTVTVTAQETKMVYLTFDDGPCKYTQQLLDVLAKYGAHATFFVTNQFPEYQGMIAKEAAAGHAVGVHSYSHDYPTIYASTDAYWKDFDAMNAVIQAQTGSTSTLMRFPGGSSNLISKEYTPGIMTQLVTQAGEKGLTYFDWNVDSTDADGHPDKDKIANSIIQGMQTHNSAVILCHDIHPETIAAMDTVLSWGQQNGYTFAALTKDSYPAHHTVKN
jgi:peptidoglycan/xylan/chitin deacetylase (PgdA/CDA1 family)